MTRHRPETIVSGLLVTLVLSALLAGCGKSGDSALVAQGQTVFEQQCAICHSLSAKEYGKTGPYLGGVVGRKAGSVDGFGYSLAFQKADFVWDEAKLDAYLAEPLKVVPDNAMGFFGISDEASRKALIAYLAKTKK